MGMIIFLGNPGAEKHILAVVNDPLLGVMMSTTYARKYMNDVHHLALDNGAYGAWVKGEKFDEPRFLRSLENYEPYREKMDFLVCPDIVAGGLSSLYYSLEWRDRLQGWPLYLAVQDDMPEHDVERSLDGFCGLFVGGTMEFKYRTAETWVALAHENGMKCHIGRIGTVNRLQWADRIGADSVDSTNFVRNDAMYVIDHYRKQMAMAI